MYEREVRDFCDKCGLPVPNENDAVLLKLLTIFPSRSVVTLFSTRPRHLLPVVHGRREICKGTPEVAQYLEGQPRDYSCLYDPRKEVILRTAFKKMREEATTKAET